MLIIQYKKFPLNPFKNKIEKFSHFFRTRKDIASYVILAVVFIYYGTSFWENYSKKDEIFPTKIKEIGRRLEFKYGMHLIGILLEEGKSIDKINVRFHKRNHFATIEENRRIIVGCIGEFLKKINHDEDLKPFLKVYPLTSKNIDIVILNFTKEYAPVYEPYVFSISSAKGNIHYFTRFKKMDAESEKEETFEEAVAILENEALLG